MQHPIAFGLAGHNYLVLRNQDNEVVSEMHGLATNPTTHEWKYIGNNPNDILQVWLFDSPRYYLAEKTFAGVILNEGTKDEVNGLWQKAESCIIPINSKQLPYPPYGVNPHGDTENSNSVAYTLSLCMGLDAKHLGLVTPGATRNLLDADVRP